MGAAPAPRLEDAHVLFMDVVAFSQLTFEIQRQVLADLQAVVHASAEYRAAQQAGRLVSLPTGDGMALVFFADPLAPVRCAVQIATALRSSGHIRLRMGIHAGAVYRVDDINANLNVTGGGINMAQRVMDCGDAGHILVSQPVAELLRQTDEWRDAVHDLGVATVKHGVTLHLYSLHRADVGNAVRPRKVTSAARKKRIRWGVAVLSVLALAGALGARYFGTSPSTGDGPAGAVSTTRKSVAVLGFRNLSGRTDRAWLSTALAQMMATELGAGGKLRTIPSDVVAQARLDLALADAADALTRDALARLRKRTGADLVVLGSYAEVGSAATAQIRLDVRLQDTEAGETVSYVAEKGPADDLFDVISRCGQQLRSRLDLGRVSPQQAEQVRASLPADPRAARLYAEGLSRLHLLDALGARDLLQQAAAAEPRNPQVHSALSAAWNGLGYQVRAAQEAKTALDLSASLSREARLSIEGQYHAASKDWAKAIEIYQSLFTFYRDNLEYGLQLATAQTRGGRGKDALGTIGALRALSSANDDPRVDLAEGDAADSVGEQKRALSAYQRAVDKARGIGAQLLMAQALKDQGWSLRALGNPAAARACLLEALRVFEQSGDKNNVARVQSDLAVMLGDEGRLGEAAATLTRALAVSREIGNSALSARLLKNLGLVLMDDGKPAAAKQCLEESLSLSRENGDREAAASTQLSLAVWQAGAGDLEAARQLRQQAARAYADIGNTHGEAVATGGLADLLMASGELAAAQASYERVHAIFAGEGNKASEATALVALANVLWMQGRLPEARTRLERALTLRQGLRLARESVETRAALARLAADEGRDAEAIPLLQEALSDLRTLDDLDPMPSVSASLVQALLRQGRVVEARQVVDQARRESKRGPGPDLAVAQARVTAAAGNVNGAVKQLEKALATTDLSQESRFVAELALGQILLAAGRTAEGTATLTALESSARSKGFGFFADRARASRS